MTVDREIGLGQNYIVLHGDPAPPLQKRAQPPIFCPCLLWSNDCMHQDTTGYGGRPQPRRHCVTGGPSSPSNTVALAEAYLRTKWHLSPSSRLATTDIVRKWGLCPFRGGVAGSPSNTVSRRPRPTAVPSGIFIHAAVWSQ